MQTINRRRRVRARSSCGGPLTRTSVTALTGADLPKSGNWSFAMPMGASCSRTVARALESLLPAPRSTDQEDTARAGRLSCLQRNKPGGCAFSSVWIHLGILRTRGGELAASRYLYCSALAAYDDVGPTLLGALAGEAVLSESQGQRPGLQYLQCATVALQF